MDDLLANKMVEKAFTEKDSSRLQALVARCDKAIQTHNARLAANLAALSEISISDTGVPLVLPFLKFQFQLPLAKRRHYAMSTQRHSHSTSERRGCPLTGGVARPRETSRQSKLLPRDLRNSLLSPDAQLPHLAGIRRFEHTSPDAQLPHLAGIRRFEHTSSPKEEFSWSKPEGGFI
jgi:hypothetical protein